jgi:dihydrofolate reductase
MGKIVLYIATSIDGRIADINGSVDYLNDFQTPGEDYGYTGFLQRINTVVMGAGTYETMLGFSYWYEGMDHIIFSTRELHVPDGRHIQQVSGDPTELVQQLRQREKDSWLVGGAQLLNTFSERGLVDEMIITIIPKFLGAGTSLWQEGKPVEETWQLLGQKSWPDGVVQLCYGRHQSSL